VRGVVTHLFSRVFVAEITHPDGSTSRTTVWYRDVPADERSMVRQGARFTWTRYNANGAYRTIAFRFDGQGR